MWIGRIESIAIPLRFVLQSKSKCMHKEFGWFVVFLFVIKSRATCAARDRHINTSCIGRGAKHKRYMENACTQFSGILFIYYGFLVTFGMRIGFRKDFMYASWAHLWEANAAENILWTYFCESTDDLCATITGIYSAQNDHLSIWMRTTCVCMKFGELV